VLISAARPTELANESVTPEGEQRGALTYALTRALRASSSPLTARDVIQQVSAEVSARFPSQHPQAEGLGLDRVVFGTTERIAGAHYLVSPSGSGAKLEGGATSGLAPGATFDVYAPAARDFSVPPVARVKLTSVRADEADAEIVSGTVQRNSRAVLRSNPFTETPLRIFFDPSVGEIGRQVKAELTALPAIREAADLTDAHLALRRTSAGIGFQTPDGQEASDLLPADGAGTPAMLVRQGTQWSSWHQILGIRNPAPTVTIDASVRRKGGGPVSEIIEGEEVEVIARNTSNQDLFFTIVDLYNDGQSEPLHPPANLRDPVAPGREIKRTFRLRTLPGRRSSVDTFKVLATSAWIDPNIFRLGPVRDPENLQSRGDASALESFISRKLAGARPADPVEIEGWTTREIPVTIRKNPVRVANFIAHYEGPADRVTSTRSALRDCNADPRACYEVAAFSPDGSAVEIVPGGTRGGVDMPLDPASAWDEAYTIRDATGAARVEPSLEYEVDEFAPDSEGARDIGSAPDKPAALANNLWSLQHANVPAAWQLMQRAGRADGEEGKSVIIGHPDTGYRKHPEIWSSDAAKSPIVSASGWDYVRNSSDTIDPFDTSGALPNPGHGTKSSSAIISPKGQQLADAAHPERFVNGVAPGARLVPLRVHRSVVHFNPARLAKAIYDAASDDRTRVKQKADVISISMGGIPTWSLWKAVKYAESRGVIVVAAAGNKVGFVVWPARFDETIAVAASNVECAMWEGSSRGSAVDITAPGESVWHAQTSASGTDSIGLGQGTTFATATTAGIAALWLDHHRGDPELRRLRADGELTAAFRRALQRASWKPEDVARRPPGLNCSPGGPWRSAVLGPGIVNAEQTLAIPLSDLRGGTRSLSRSSLDELPLFASVFPAGSEIVTARYTAIFGLPASDLRKVAAYEAEVMQQYALSDEVRTAIDALGAVPNPRPEHYDAVRRALERRPISNRLRNALKRN
jgi:hypothetical protein